MKRTEQKTGLIQLDAQARAAIQLVADLRAQVAAKEAQISAMRSFATGENAELQMAEQELAGLRAQEERMGAASEGTTNALVPKGNMQEAGIEYVRKLRDVKYYETIFDLLARQYEVAKVDEARQGAIIQVVDRAVVPDRRSSPANPHRAWRCGFRPIPRDSLGVHCSRPCPDFTESSGALAIGRVERVDRTWKEAIDAPNEAYRVL